MPRQKIHSRVGALPTRQSAEAAPSLFDLLRSFGLDNQRDQPQVFPPIREVARHFGVPTSTIARIYRRLEEEGLLVTVRGSRTLLQGLSSARLISARGVIGLPVFTPRFVTLQDYRSFFLRLAPELRVRGFAVATVFYDAADVQAPERLHLRIEKHGFDTVLWHQPDRAAKTVACQLTDSGVRVFGVRDRGFPSISCRYEVDRASAIASILDSWREKVGVRSVVVVRGRETSAAKEELIKHLLDDARLSYRFAGPSPEQTSDFLDSLARDAGEAIVLPSSAAAMCAFRAPESLARLMNRSRVMLSGGCLSFPFTHVPEAVADVVVVDWQLVAEQIASDLIGGNAFHRGESTSLEAKPHLRAPLRDYAQSL